MARMPDNRLTISKIMTCIAHGGFEIKKRPLNQNVNSRPCGLAAKVWWNHRHAGSKNGTALPVELKAMAGYGLQIGLPPTFVTGAPRLGR
jgi:hypothetical protein